MSYEFYKIIHIICFAGVLVATSLLAYAPKKKIYSIVQGVCALLIFVSGMGLMARIGISHGAGWPAWIKVKMGLYIGYTIVPPILIKRFNKNIGFLVLMISFVGLIYTAVSQY